MEGYVFEKELDNSTKARVAASFFSPGEAVLIADIVELPQALAELKAHQKPVTIEKLFVTSDSHIEFSLVGHPGRYGANYFQDARKIRHVYGAMIAVDDRVFVVTMTDDSGTHASGEVSEIRGDPERHVQWNQRLSSEEDLKAMLLEDRGIMGEFRMALRDDGAWSLVSIPWSTSISDYEIELAQHTVETSTAQNAPTP